MRKSIALITLLVGVSSSLFAANPKVVPQPSPTSREIINTMLARIQAGKTLKFNLKTWERINGKDHYSDADVKLQNSPLKLYLHSNAEPNKNVEILYNPALYGNKAKVNPGKFLPTLSMDLYGSRMRKDQHHVVLKSGFTFLATTIQQAVIKADKEAGGQFENYFKLEGEVSWDGHNCYKITINDPTFKYLDYTVKQGETVQSLEDGRYICGYLIIEKNPDVHDFYGLREGMKIKIPSTYAKKTTLLIDKETYMPIAQTMYDEVGQFERYEFHNLQVNPNLSEKDFTTSGDGYKF